jgi:type II secretory pathway component PulJ
MSIEERVIKLEEFASDVREYTRILTAMIQRHDERLDEHAAEIAELRAAESNADARIAALADAQIRTEDALKKLIERDDERRRSNGSGQ